MYATCRGEAKVNEEATSSVGQVKVELGLGLGLG